MGSSSVVQSVDEKVRRSKAFPRAYSFLVNAAEQKQVVTYGELANIMGLPPTGNHTGNMVGILLGLITESEHDGNRPMLSAVAVSSTHQMPGTGFYGLAEQYGLLSSDASTEEKRTFWRTQRDLVYEEWSR